MTSAVRGPFPAAAAPDLSLFAASFSAGPHSAVSWVQTGWEVKRVFVSPAYRRRALAQQALARVEGSARGRGVRELVLQTGILQPEAIALYSRAGWERIPGFGPYAGDGVSVCFRKALP